MDFSDHRGRGGLVVRSRPRDRRVAGSKPDSTEDPPFLAFSDPKRKGGVIADAARRQQSIRKCERELLKLTKKETMAQRGRDRRVEETEQNNSRLSDMAQRDHERRAEETKEQRNSRLLAMVQHARERRLNVIEGQNHHQIQTFYAARTVLYSLFI
ncbi:hypothetical protein AVEN_215637-1 [Araneus ventricosus]|uniref:STPR domain-containing protein n=1 Tax=Araneus ventricosus TaxID=182803 RepID=A0A4Y2KF23_ARAVE|nr:hypothetical protein AVEN_215637-1 [Araneus ventricosus]